MNKPPDKNQDRVKKADNLYIIQLDFLLKKEIILGFLFILLGVFFLFKKLLYIDLDIIGIFSAILLILGVWMHLKSFQEKNFLRYFLTGQMLLLLSLSISDHLIPIGLEKIFVLFILFLLTAASALAYTLQRDNPLLIVASALTLILIATYIFSSEATLRIHGTAAIWFLAYLFYYLSIAKPHRSRLFLMISGLLFLFGFINISSSHENLIPIVFLWLLAGTSVIFYARNKERWIFFLLTYIFLMAGFQLINESLIHIFPDGWMAFFWMAGFAAVFLFIWYIGKPKKRQKWPLWLAAIFGMAGAIILITDVAELEGEIVTPAILIIIGIWMIYSKAIRQGQRTKKN